MARLRPDSRPTTALVRLLAGTGALLALLLAACGSPTGGVSGVRVPEPQGAPAAAEPLSAADATAWLDGVVPAALADDGIAGASVSVVKDGRVLLTRGYGRADTGTGDAPARAVDPAATLFRVGSVSKVVTATAVLQLVEQGRLDLDADVAGYLDFPLPEPKGRITLRNLLTHTAGFEERVRPLLALSGSPVDLRTYVAVEPPEQVFAPGTVPAYSNYGNALAGYVVQRVSGVPFDDYVQRHVLARAGMTRSTFAQPLPADLAPLMSAGYADDSRPPTPFELVAPAPAGALTTTAADMGRFMLAQLDDLPADQRLVAPATLARMHAPALGADALGTLAGGPRMGLGFFDESRNGHRIVGHDGDTGVFHAAFEVLPDDDAGIFVALNSSGRVATATLDLREALMHGFADRYYPAPGAPEVGAPSGGGGHAALLAGTYESSRAPRSTFLSVLRLSGQTHVSAEPDGTVVISPRPNGRRPARYAEVSPGTWREVGGQETVSVRPAAGRVEVIGFDSAFAVLRVAPAHDAGVVVPAVGAAYAVLVLALLLAPVAALVRRRYGVRSARPDTPLPRRLARAGAGAVVAAAVGWAVVVQTALGFTDVGDPALRVLQGLQLLGLVAVVPAAWSLTSVVRRRAGVLATLTSALVLVALVVVAGFALAYGLLGPSVSY